jgi:hypothetical protein
MFGSGEELLVKTKERRLRRMQEALQRSTSTKQGEGVDRPAPGSYRKPILNTSCRNI